MGGGIGSILYSDRTAASGGGPVEFYTYNAVGHTVATTDDLGDIVSANVYEAFGNVVSSSGTSDNNRLANTKERDASLGLDNHGFRYYDPGTGRYLTRDPIGYADGMNVYLSVHSNPINHIDPLGLQDAMDDYYRTVAEAYGYPPDHSPAGTWGPADNYPLAQANWEAETRRRLLNGEADRVARPVTYHDPEAQLRGASVAADMLPVVGTAKGIYEVVTGRDPLTGQELSTTDRVISGAATAVSILPFGRLIGKGVGKGVATVAGWFGRHGDEAAEAAQGAVKQVDNLVAPEVSTRPHRQLVDDFKTNPQDWERTAAQVGPSDARATKGEVNVETQWGNKNTRETLSTHEVGGPVNPHPENISPNLPEGGAIRPGNKAKGDK